MARGRVQSWNGNTGFLVDEADGQRVFFGDRSLRGIAASDVAAGLVLEFERGQGPKGPRADNVRRPGSAAPVAPRGAARATQPAGAPRPPARAGNVPEPPEEIALPRPTQAVIRQVPLAERHPGLQLDRFIVPGAQERQRDSLLDVTRVPGDRTLFAEVSRRRTDCLRAAGVEPWTRTTAGPLTLQLARSNALENAGLCLHPIYGFAYLPGSGLKGMARAYAETVARVPAADVEAVFGNKPGEPVKERQKAGAVVFHDAWPVVWPALIVDIVNNHHPRYYQGEDAPGDWDSPNPVYFLALPPGTAFEFAVGKRRDDTESEARRGKAREWLEGALTHLGAGAKTVAGYGTFLPVDGSTSSCPGRKEATATLELVTPGFLAGASQLESDCDLRPATLRGLLRWWWRTLHAGHLSRDELRALEAALWGDTEAGGAIALRLVPAGAASVRLYEHHPDRVGVRYLAYGMDEKSKGERRRRWTREAGSVWTLRLTARATRYVASREDLARRGGIDIDADQVLEQAVAALWLLTEFGGAGSKSRKGFGSLKAAAISGRPLDMPRCLDLARQLRDYLKIDHPFDGARAESPSLSDPERQLVEIPTSWLDPLQTLDAVGCAYQAVAQHQRFKHNPAKAAWGLPRKIHGPRDDGPLPRQSRDTWQPPEWLDFPKRPRDTRPENARHAAPIHVHLARADGGLVVRILALPAKYLRDRAESVRMLREFVDGFRSEFSSRLQAAPGPGRPGAPPRAPAPQAAAVTVKVLERREAGGKVSFVVQEADRPKGMLMYGNPPATLPAVGDAIQVYRNNVDPRSPQYRWDPPPPPAPAGRPPRRR